MGGKTQGPSPAFLLAVKPCAYKHVNSKQMSKIKDLAPKRFWGHFHTLTQIPRPSKKEARIIEVMKTFGEN
ncbi:MAG: hypothetical protein R2751_18075 [Bacteroidales bacterium]